ncbi:hypothetical protein HDU92_006269 [Lobulomyces angularis]|nr:hypothetical protein HDU92_006269 [Lobulomyces angularis]
MKLLFVLTLLIALAMVASRSYGYKKKHYANPEEVEADEVATLNAGEIEVNPAVNDDKLNEQNVQAFDDDDDEDDEDDDEDDDSGAYGVQAAYGYKKKHYGYKKHHHKNHKYGYKKKHYKSYLDAENADEDDDDDDEGGDDEQELQSQGASYDKYKRKKYKYKYKKRKDYY